jgi:hypothetical protein
MAARFVNVKRSALIIAAALALLLPGSRANDTKVDVSKIHGKIQFVKSFPDYKVQAVTSFPDLRVEIVDSLPGKAGEWQIVTSFPDYKIQMVDSFPDFTVQFVTSFPGPAK